MVVCSVALTGIYSVVVKAVLMVEISVVYSVVYSVVDSDSSKVVWLAVLKEI